MKYEKIAFLGACKMGKALMQGIVAFKMRRPTDILASDASEKALADLPKDLIRANATRDNVRAARESDVVVIAVKPGVVPDVLKEIRGVLGRRHLLLSIAAGVTIGTIESALKPGVRVVRAMPNLPCQVGETAAAFALGTNATAEDGRFVESFFGAVGKAFPVEEKMLDAVTGLSGSGPAYVFIAIEALADGGVRMGLPRKTALALAAQTVLGAAQMVVQTGRHPADLKDEVTSPGGTTMAGIQVLEDRGFRAALIAAVEAATKRSSELQAASAPPTGRRKVSS